jgi:hypothetical protein
VPTISLRSGAAVMIVERTTDGKYVITAATDELIALGNCPNEVCNGIDLFELETRVGASREKIAEMLATILSAQNSR